MKKLLYVLLFITLSFSNGFCQISTVDSLKQELKTAKNDTTKLRLLNEMVKAENDDKIWPLYNEEMKNTAEKLLSTHPNTIVIKTAKKYLIDALNYMGKFNFNQGDNLKALEYWRKSLKISEEIGDKEGVAYFTNNIGVLYSKQGNISQALEYHTKSLNTREEIGDKSGIANSFNNIGAIYDIQGDIPKALEYYHKALKIREEIGDKKGVAISLNNIGFLYQDNGDFSKALEYHTISLKTREEIGDKSGIANSLNNIGYIYKNQGDISKALEYCSKSLKIQEDIGDKDGKTYSFKNIGDIYLLQHKPLNAKNYYEKSYQISKELGYPANIEAAAKGLRKVYENLGNYQLAYHYYQEEIIMRDSLQNEENYKASVQQRTKYEYDKKAATDSIANVKEKEIKDAEIAKQQAQIKVKRFQQYGLIGGLVLVLIFAGFVFNRLKVTQRQKVIIEVQKQEVEKQKELVEEKHKEITDSINYAERIQRSFLATTEMLDQHLKDYFVFFRPKDVVSGDFYWAGELNNGNFAYSCADSTGHGVPGAIMSILNISSLEKSIEKETAPEQILNKTRKIIIDRLKKDGSSEGGKDGMDCSLLVINQDRTQLSFAAANNPVFILRPIVIASGAKQSHSNEQIASLPTVVRNDDGEEKVVRNDVNEGEVAGNDGYELIEFKPDKMPVGKHDNDTESFTLHTALLQKGDVIYALTDGFPDQFGGEKGKKYMIKNFKELLLQIAHLPMLEQEQTLAMEFDKWKGSNEQVDDVCIIGVRI